MYELYDPCTVMFFYRLVISFLFQKARRIDFQTSRNKHIMIDLGTGNNNKMYATLYFLMTLLLIVLYAYRNWAMDNKQEVGTFNAS